MPYVSNFNLIDYTTRQYIKSSFFVIFSLFSHNMLLLTARKTKSLHKLLYILEKMKLKAVNCNHFGGLYMKIKKIIFIIFFAIIVIISSYTSICGASALYTSSSLLETVSDTETDLKLESDGAILIEQSTGSVLYEHNAHERFRPASVTKVMSLLLIMEAIDNR